MYITSINALRDLYAPARERSVKKQLNHLDVFCRKLIALSPFVVVASQGLEQHLDASPRGGDKGFCKVIDEHTLLIPDSPGNNRLDTLENIVASGRNRFAIFGAGHRRNIESQRDGKVIDIATPS